MGTCWEGRGSIRTTCARVLMCTHVNRLDFRPTARRERDQNLFVAWYCTHSSSYHTSRPYTFACEGSYTTVQPGCVHYRPSRHSFSPLTVLAPIPLGPYTSFTPPVLFILIFPVFSPLSARLVCWLLFLSPWVVVTHQCLSCFSLLSDLVPTRFLSCIYEKRTSDWSAV